MKTAEIIQKINPLPLVQKMLILENIIHSIREEEQKAILEEAADALYDDYKSDKSLTDFVRLDYEEFYEAR
jgi:hypothetical protein